MDFSSFVIQLDALVEVGVKQVVLAVSYRAEDMENELRSYAEQVLILWN